VGRSAQQLLDAATATGTFASYEGDGATVPQESNARWSPNYGFFTQQTYKEHLDQEYPEAFRLHDWCYTPYGSLIGVTREEADMAMGEMIGDRWTGRPPIRRFLTPESLADSAVCFAAVRVGGGPWFGSSTVGFDPSVFAAANLGNVPLPDLAQAAADLQRFLTLNDAIWSPTNMPVYKYTVGLQRVQGTPAAGFSELWYFNAASDDEARNRVTDYISERAKILSRSWQVGTFSRLAVMSANCKRFKPQGRDKYCCIPKVEGRVQCVCPTPQTGKLAADADQNWDGLLVEMCSDSILHTGCSKCSPQTKPFVANRIFRGVPDSWYSNGEPSIPVIDKGKVQAFLNFLQNSMKVGSVGCSDACSDTDASSCTSVVFALFVHFCPRYDQIHKRNTGRPFGLARGRRSRRRVA